MCDRPSPSTIHHSIPIHSSHQTTKKRLKERRGSSSSPMESTKGELDWQSPSSISMMRDLESKERRRSRSQKEEQGERSPDTQSRTEMRGIWQCKWMAWMSVMVCLLGALPLTSSSDLSLPFSYDPSSNTQSRFASLAGNVRREKNIRVYVMKNISEDTPVGTELDTFKAHDKEVFGGVNYT